MASNVREDGPYVEYDVTDEEYRDYYLSRGRVQRIHNPQLVRHLKTGATEHQVTDGDGHIWQLNCESVRITPRGLHRVELPDEEFEVEEFDEEFEVADAVEEEDAPVVVKKKKVAKKKKTIRTARN